MDHDGCVEMTILGSAKKVSSFNTLRTSSTKTLSTFHENNSHLDSENKTFNLRRSWEAKKLRSRAQSFIEEEKFVHQSNNPCDIELLLRLYALDSNMEKSIQRLVEEAAERNFGTAADRYAKSLSANFPSIELGAAYRLIHFLKESCCKNPSAPSYCEILLALRKLVADCNDKRLKRFLLNDPSLTVCERCGVISCAKPLDFVQEQSHERPQFLRDSKCCRTIDSEDLVRAYNKIKNSRNEREQGDKLFTIHKLSEEREKIRKEIEDRSLTHDQLLMNASSTVKEESLVPEKEIPSNSREIIELHITNESPRNDPLSQLKKIDDIKPTVPKSKIERGQTELQWKYKANYNHTKFNDANLNSLRNHIQESHSKQCEKFKIERIPRRDKPKLFLDEHSKILDSEVEREKRRSQSEFKAEILNTLDTIEIIDECPNNGPGRAITSDNVRAIVDRAKYLARGPFTAASKKERVPISQCADAMSLKKSQHIVRKRGFVLHGSRDDIPQIDTAFSLHERTESVLYALREAEQHTKPVTSSDYCEQKLAYKCMEHNAIQKQSDSLTWSVENDSLENCTALRETCVKPGESDTTGCSSSSAENFMREWIARSLVRKETDIRDRASDSGRSITPEPSSNILGQVATRKKREDAVNYASQATGDIVRQSKIDSPKEASGQYSNNLVDGRIFSRNDSRLIPTIEEKDEMEESRGEPILNRKLRDYEDFLRKGNQVSHTSLDDTLKAKSSLNRGACEHFLSNQMTSVNVHGNRQAIATEMLKFYEKMFEDTREMNWESFQVFVEEIHPRQKELWRDICQAVTNEAKRVADKEGANTEVCIEITPIDDGNIKKEMPGSEIVFEMDITFADIETFLAKKPSTDGT